MCLPAGQFVDASIEKAVDTDSREDAAHSRIARPLVDFHIIADDDILFLDFGPIFEEWEADFGRTFVLGDDAVRDLLITEFRIQ